MAQQNSSLKRRHEWLVPIAAGCFGLLSCTGQIGTPSEVTVDGNASPGNSTGGAGSTSESSTTAGGPEVTDCVSPSPGGAPLRRLSNAEYRNSVTDLFAGVDGIDALVGEATRDFPPESESLGFRNNAEFLTVQPLVAQKYMDAAEEIAARVAIDDAWLPCSPEDVGDSACAQTVIETLGSRVYRRPLTNTEATRYQTMFDTALADYDFQMGVEWVVFAMLQSPNFLHRVEFGQPSSEAVTRPTPLEMATRLSYLFWQSTPDERLIQAAEANELDTASGVETLAREMLADARSDRLFQYFAEWLDLDELDAFNRDPEVFEDLPAELPDWFETETHRFVANLLSRSDGNLTELYTARYTFVNSGLAEHYGLTAPDGSGFVKVDAPGRSGVLTQAMLWSHDKPYRTSIVRRGLKIRTDLLCQNVPAPPNDVPLDLDAPDAQGSQRERLEQHRTNATCAGCHDRLDPIGVALDNFDAVGRARSTDESGAPIVTESELSGTDVDGPIADARELGARLAQSEEARDCYLTQTFRFFFGRELENADACSMDQLRQAFDDSDQSLSELLIALTQTDAFLYRPVITESE